MTRLLTTMAACLVIAGAASAQQGHPPLLAVEQQQLAVLRSDAPAADRAIACKRLAIDGSREAVPELAKLLSDKELASWARIALEAISGPESAEALRSAAARLDGRLRVGAINSLGVLRDQQSETLLTELLASDDAQAASAAAVALGRIGGDSATKALVAALATAPPQALAAVAEGCVLSAEAMHASGDAAGAARVYNAVRTSAAPAQCVLEATRGAILAGGPAGTKLLLEQLQAEDADFFRIALSTAREAPGRELDRSLAEQLPKLPPERAALLVQAMADRRQTVVLPAIVRAAEQGPAHVRAAAVRVLAQVGDKGCLPILLRIALTEQNELADHARETLAQLQGDGIDAWLQASLDNAQEEELTVLLETIGRRRIDAVPAIERRLSHPDQRVRNAALFALGETVELRGLPLLISRVVSTERPEDREAAGNALVAASVRMPDREACAAELTAAIEHAPSAETRVALLNILGQMGGATALGAVGQAAGSDDPALQDAGTRLLGEWMTADAAPVLLKLAAELPEGNYRVRAVRGYIRIARQLPVSAADRTEMCRQALEVATRPEEQALVLQVLERYPSRANLRLANQAADLPGLSDAASKTAQAITEKLAARRGG